MPQFWQSRSKSEGSGSSPRNSTRDMARRRSTRALCLPGRATDAASSTAICLAAALAARRQRLRVSGGISSRSSCGRACRRVLIRATTSFAFGRCAGCGTRSHSSNSHRRANIGSCKATGDVNAPLSEFRLPTPAPRALERKCASSQTSVSGSTAASLSPLASGGASSRRSKKRRSPARPNQSPMLRGSRAVRQEHRSFQLPSRPRSTVPRTGPPQRMPRPCR
mmetsp:Transcript_53404/g.115411  ORF Transcript_53404/g.115411 Transcript_53404/m.115411 type:complete len:223 (+) Transcript_53404:591-1259(+)